MFSPKKSNKDIFKNKRFKNIEGFNKYGNIKTTVDDITFDSKAEANRYSVLKRAEENGEIEKLTLQCTYHLIVNGMYISKYIADFVYQIDGEVFVEDVKSPALLQGLFVVKRKLMFALHDVKIIVIPPSEVFYTPVGLDGTE